MERGVYKILGQICLNYLELRNKRYGRGVYKILGQICLNYFGTL